MSLTLPIGLEPRIGDVIEVMASEHKAIELVVSAILSTGTVRVRQRFWGREGHEQDLTQAAVDRIAEVHRGPNTVYVAPWRAEQLATANVQAGWTVYDSAPGD